MAAIIRGSVHNGIVVPDSPLPEGAQVEIHLRSRAQDSAAESDPLAPARARGNKAREALLAAEGRPLTVRQVARRLNLSVAEVEERRRSHRLLAVEIGKHDFRYPRWQFANNNTLPGLEKVLTALRLFTPWTQLSFFLGGNYRLEGATPLQALRQGKVDAVRRAARTYGEQGAG